MHRIFGFATSIFPYLARLSPSAVTLFLRTTDGTYCYSSSTSKSVQGPRAETLRVTVGDANPTPSTSTGDIKNTIVFDNIVDLSVQGVTISFSPGDSPPAYLGRYVALQVRWGRRVGARQGKELGGVALTLPGEAGACLPLPGGDQHGCP